MNTTILVNGNVCTVKNQIDSCEKSKIFIISDLHLNHFNIIKYCNRPFKSIEEMNEAIINNWNSKISDNDLVYFLGDFCLGGRNVINNFTERLKGRKIIISGNHDRSRNVYLEAGFEEYYKNRLMIHYKGRDILLSHKPELGYNNFNIHGHIHDKLMEALNYFNACVEQTGYMPVELDWVISEYDKRFNKE